MTSDDTCSDMSTMYVLQLGLKWLCVNLNTYIKPSASARGVLHMLPWLHAAVNMVNVQEWTILTCLSKCIKSLLYLKRNIVHNTSIRLQLGV